MRFGTLTAVVPPASPNEKGEYEAEVETRQAQKGSGTKLFTDLMTGTFWRERMVYPGGDRQPLKYCKSEVQRTHVITLER